MNIRFGFTYRAEDLDEWSQSPAAIPPLRSRIVSMVVGWTVFLVLGSALVVITAERSEPTPALGILKHVLFGLIAFLIFGVLAYGFYRSWQSPGAETISHSPDLSEPTTVQLEEEGVRMHSGSASTQWKWSAWNRWYDLPGLLVLRSRSDVVCLLPKRAMSADQIDATRQLFRHCVSDTPTAAKTAYKQK